MQYQSYLPILVFVLVLLTIDLGVFHRKAHAVSLREAASWYVVWVSLAILFNLGIFLWLGADKGTEFLAGYIIEVSLSVDNVFVFLIIFSYFAVPGRYQHRVLFFGILGAIVMLMLGLDISVVGLLMIIPVVFLISYGVPGIPGELVLFAGPIATLMNITDPTLPIFLAVYIGIQLGLPDSFRTGSNSTDDYVQAILMNAVYEQRFAGSAGTPAARQEELQAVDTS